MSQLKQGAILSYLTILLTNIIGLALTPFIIRSLGDAEYGLYTLIGALAGYITVMDLGLNNTIVRFVAKYRAEGDKKGEENFLAITMILYGLISLAVVLVGIGVYYNLDNIFSQSLTAEELQKAQLMFFILVLNIALTLPGGAFTAICNGYEHFVFPRTINLLRYLIRSALVVTLLLHGGDAIGLVLLDTVMNLLVIGINGLYTFRKLRIRFRLHTFHMPLVREIFTYSIWIFVMVVVYELQWKGGQVLVGIKTDTTSVAVYAVGVLLGTYYSTFANAVNGVFLPKAMQMVVHESTGKELTDITIKVGRITSMILLFILGGFLCFGEEFIKLWVGENYRSAWLIAVIIMLSSTNILILSFANTTLKAMKLFRFKGYIYLIFITLGTLLGYCLIDAYGITGMTVGICLGWVMSQVITNKYINKKTGINIFRSYKEILGRLSMLFAAAVIIGTFINYLLPLGGWIFLAIKAVLYALFYTFIVYLGNMNEDERKLLRNIVRNK